MKLFKLDKDKLNIIRSQSFKTEKGIQALVEKNLDELFGLEFVQTELTVKSFRLDTLCFDPENKSFVIIEYKKDRNFSVIDQGYTYLSLLLNNKSDFVLEYNECMDKNLRKDDVDWTQSRIIFISTTFTDYQKHSINFKDVPFELWVIKRYENNYISFNKHTPSSNVSIKTTFKDTKSVASKVSREVKVYNEDYHLYEKSKRRNDFVIELYKLLREKILSLGDDVEIIPRGTYISYRRGRPFVDVVIYQDGLYIIINMKKGTLNDPNNQTKDVSEKGHWGNGDYTLLVKEKTDLDYVMFLISQSYKDKDSIE